MFIYLSMDVTLVNRVCNSSNDRLIVNTFRTPSELEIQLIYSSIYLRSYKSTKETKKLKDAQSRNFKFRFSF